MLAKTAKNPPLSSATLHILLALAGGNLHGYGIIKEVARNSDGHYRIGPGTLYDNLKKLISAGLVADAPTSSSSKRKAASAQEDDRRGEKRLFSRSSGPRFLKTRSGFRNHAL